MKNNRMKMITLIFTVLFLFAAVVGCGKGKPELKEGTGIILLRVNPEISIHYDKEGLCLVNAMHITASVFINDNESGLHRDFERWLEKLAPEKPYDQYDHNGYEDNADAHLKRSVMGREVVVAVTEGRLDFGPWERIFYGEFDGKRPKRVLIKIIGE
jgi:secondary thiamine-phosphate synthase enzyme